MAGERRYTKTHEWVVIEDAFAVVGITDHAQSALGDITYIDVTALNEEVAQGDEIAVIESVKAASDIFAPISGVVAESNALLEDRPELVNQDPLGEGWIIKLKNFAEKEMETLLTEKEYYASLEAERI